MIATLSSLPPELLSSICHSLEREDLCALRLTSTTLALETQEIFADRAFKEIILALTSDGLDFLRNISGHKVFSTYVAKLWILPSLFGGHFNWDIKEIERQRETYEILTQDQERRFRSSYLPLPDGPYFPPKGSVDFRYLAYQEAVTDHFSVLSPLDKKRNDHTLLQDTLQSCLPSLPNLRTVGLRNHEGNFGSFTLERCRRKVSGVRRLIRQLGFNPVNPSTAMGGQGPSYNTIFNSWVFTILMSAIGAVNISTIETIHTLGGMMVDDGLYLTVAEEESLIPILQQLRHLSLSICLSHGQQAERQLLVNAENEVSLSPFGMETQDCDKRNKYRLLPIFSKSAPSLETMCFSTWPGWRISSTIRESTDLDLSDDHFNYVSRNFHFSRLTDLTLEQIITTVPSLTMFLATAMPTLRRFIFQSVTLTNNRTSFSEEIELEMEGVRVCQQVCAHLRDHSTLCYLRMSRLKYQRAHMEVIDPVHGFRGTHQLIRTTDTALYNDKRADLPFREWIDKLQFKKR